MAEAWARGFDLFAAAAPEVAQVAPKLCRRAAIQETSGCEASAKYPRSRRRRCHCCHPYYVGVVFTI